MDCVRSPSNETRSKVHPLKQCPSLMEDAAGDSWRYLFYRGRLSLINFGIRNLFYFLDLYIVFLFFGTHVLFSYGFLRLGIRFISEIWWASLEGFRAEIRKRKELSVLGIFPIRVGTPLILALLFAISSSLILSHFFSRLPLILFLFPLCLRLTTEVLHSSLNALQRIHRPFWTFLFLECSHTLLLVLAHRWGGDSLLWVALSFNLLCFFVQTYFLKKALRQRKILLSFQVKLKDFKNVFSHFSSQHATLFLARNLIEASLYFILYYWNPILGRVPMLIMAHLLFPLITTSDAWFRSFYADLSKLASWQTQGFYKLFAAKLFVFTGLYFPLLLAIWATSIQLIFPLISPLVLFSSGIFFVIIFFVKAAATHLYFKKNLEKWRCVLPLDLAQSYLLVRSPLWKVTLQYFSQINDKGFRLREDQFSHPKHLYVLMKHFEVESFFIKNQTLLFYSTKLPTREFIYRVTHGLIKDVSFEKVGPQQMKEEKVSTNSPSMRIRGSRERYRYLMSFLTNSFWGRNNSSFSILYEGGAIHDVILKEKQKTCSKTVTGLT